MRVKSNDSSDKWSILSLFNPFKEDISIGGRVGRGVMLLILLYFIVAPFICIYEYNRAFKPFFNPIPADAAKNPPKPGVVYSGAMITVGDQMLEAWLPNDIVWPSILLDNPQNYQLGVLEVLRYSTRVLRDDLSRQRTTDKIDPYCEQAFTAFSNNPYLWMFPAAESKFASGVKSLQKYQQGLNSGQSHFYSRTDNLIVLTEQFASLLGGESTKLSNAPRDRVERTSAETAGDPNLVEKPQKTFTKVPWLEIDDNFYHAQGVAYAMREMLIAARWEFRDVIEIKRSGALLDSVIDELELAQFEPWIILNGSRDSVFANHSLTMMATLQDARQKLRSFAETMKN